MRPSHCISDFGVWIDSAVSDKLLSPAPEVRALRVRLIRAMRAALIRAIDTRLTELAELTPHDRCLLCRYPSSDDICPPCLAGHWPPYNAVFRTQGQAYAAWFAVNAIPAMKAIDQAYYHSQELLQDLTASEEPIRQALARLQDLILRDLPPYPKPKYRRGPVVVEVVED